MIDNYLKLLASGEVTVREVLESAMEDAAEKAVDDFRAMLCVDNKLEEVTTTFNNTLGGKFGTKDEIAKYFIDLHIASGNEPKVIAGEYFNF